MATFAVIGAGQAGIQVVDRLRREQFDGRVVLIGEEPHLPYQRPPLSKKFLTGEFPAERLQLRPAKFFSDREIEVRTSCHVAEIDRSEKLLRCLGGDDVSYDQLAICTGTSVNRLPVPGADLNNVYYLRTLADTADIEGALHRTTRVAVIGGGFIGLEVAASLRKLGKSVTLIEAMQRLMERAVTPAVSSFVADLHRSHGVDLRLDSQVSSINDDASGSATSVELASGETIDTDMVIIGIGVHANTQLAEAAGLRCDNGVLVDEYARTSDNFVVAAGDCSRFPSKYSGGLLRLESVQNAMDQAKIAAMSMLGTPVAYDDVPWFWSDQYDKKLQMVGLSAGHAASVVRGSIEDGAFSIFYFSGDESLMAIDSVNDPASHMVGRRIIASAIPLSAADMQDPDFDIKSLLKKP